MNKSYQLIRRNTNGSIIIEYPVYHNMSINIPVGADGLPLSGLNLHKYISAVVSGLTSSDVINQDIDPLLSAELGLDKL